MQIWAQKVPCEARRLWRSALKLGGAGCLQIPSHGQTLVPLGALGPHPPQAVFGVMLALIIW
eukprot:99294-Alexandrium_andersonii.AAC.1